MRSINRSRAMSFLVVVSIKGRIAATAYSRAAARVGALGLLEEFFCVGFVVLALGDTLLASSVAGLASVEL